MLVTLAILILSALLALAVQALPRYRRWSRLIAPGGIALALATHLATEVFGSQATQGPVAWPPALAWLGEPVYRTDALSAGLGTWCLLIGLVYVWLALDDEGEASNKSAGSAAWKIATGILVIAVLYSLAHTWDLRIYAAQTLVLAILAWALGYVANDREQQPESGTQQYGMHNTQFAVAALFLLSAVLLIGRTTGGDYSLANLPLPALTAWPLALLLVGVGLWLGFAPFTGWGLRGYQGAEAMLAQTLLASVPVILLLLRLQNVVAAGVIGPAPESWTAFMRWLAWGGGVTALVAGAGMMVLAGTHRWWTVAAAQTMGLAALALGLGSPQGDYTALVLLIAWGAARVAFELARDTKIPAPVPLNPLWASGVALLSLAALPLTAGFVGVWLLASDLADTGNTTAAVALVGVVVLGVSSAVLHFMRDERLYASETVQQAKLRALMVLNPGGVLRLSVALLIAVALLIGGIVPGLWLPAVASVAGVPNATVAQTWWGIEAELGRAAMPGTFLAVGALVLVGAARLGTQLATKRQEGKTGARLLPAAQKRLQKLEGGQQASIPSVIPARLPAPTPVRWLSLLWLEHGLSRWGAATIGWCARAGVGLARLEGRYYLPLALVLVLVAMLALGR